MAWSPTRVWPEACSVLSPGDDPPATPRSVLARHPTGFSPAPLPGGTANRGLVVRVGDTVRRPTAPCWPATHALLAHLSRVGFDGAPRVLAAGPATEMPAGPSQTMPHATIAARNARAFLKNAI